MKYCVIDTERIKGNQIYLLSYQTYDEDFRLVESKTYQDISIDLSNRKSPKTKVNALDSVTIKVNSFTELYHKIVPVIEDSFLIVFSRTDIGVLKQNCKDNGLQYTTVPFLDLQKILYDLSDNKKHKSNLKLYCKKNNIKYSPHIPESDCSAAFSLYQNLLQKYGNDYLTMYIDK